jgi:hypothetical protein
VLRKIKLKRNTKFILLFACLIICSFLLAQLVYVSAWMNSYSTYQGEKIIADLTVYKKELVNGKPTFYFNYTPRNDNTSALWYLFRLNFKNRDQGVKAQFIGNKLILNADFIQLSDSMDINYKTAYRVNTLNAGFYDAGDANNFGIDTLEIYPNADSLTPLLQREQSKYNFFVKKAYRSTTTVIAQDEDKAYFVIVTDKGIEIIDMK